MYQPSRGVMAVAPQSPEPSFSDEIRSVARRLFFSTPSASAADKQFLQDIARDECRYPMKAVERLARIAQQSTRPEHQDALAEVIRRRSLPIANRVDVGTAFDHELQAQTIADVAQREFERHPSKATKETVLERLAAHAVAIRESISAIMAARVQ